MEWKPGKPPGRSMIVDDWDNILADAGHNEGYVNAEIDLGSPRRQPMSYGARIEVARQFLFEDRKPETYGRLTEK